jgi:hypothetical protein
VTILRAAIRLLALPGRLLIRGINRASVRPLGGFLRGAMHGFVWVLALMAISMATYTAPPATAAAPVVHSAPRYTPPPVPDIFNEPTAEPTAPPPAEVPEIDVPYVPVPDDDHDFDKPRICHRKWWC